MRKLAIIGVFIASLIMMGMISEPSHAQIVGGYKPAAVDDEGVVAAANFAVSKEEETTEGIDLDAVLKAERQIVAGTNYRLCLRVKLGDDSQVVEAIVYQDLKGAYTLKSWTPKECGE
jgi:cystatin-C